MERLREEPTSEETAAATPQATAEAAGRAGKALNEALVRYTLACSSLNAALLDVGKGAAGATEIYDAARELKRVRYNECREALELVLARIGVGAP